VGYDPFIKVNLPHAINFRALRGANVVTVPSKFGGTETLEVHRVEWVNEGGGSWRSSSGKSYFSFIRWQRILLRECFSLVILKNLCSKIRFQRMREK